MDYLIKAIVFGNIVHQIGDSLKKKINSKKKIDHGLSAGEIKRRMVGIPVYKLSTYSEDDICVISDDDDRKTVSFYFINKPDALDYFDMAKLYHNFGNDWRIFDTPLSDFIDQEGQRDLSIRLVPESSQIKNAIKEKEKEKDMPTSTPDDNINIFTGVPVFKPSELRLHLSKTGEHLRPAFLRKEDLQERLTAWDMSTDTIEVSSLEETIQEMKDSSTNKSNDILFIGGHGDTSWTWINETY
ncbi:hypothetical protein CASFOL_027407 [Castilleja foliolosa]|uniref:Uncharacterized protein n=1 Tax=Castilleja foliolosa TaxID=1961234 RepID=A0ABD3CH71_9LAMI